MSDEEIRKTSSIIFNSSCLRIKAYNLNINSDSLSLVFEKLKSNNPIDGLEFAKNIQVLVNRTVDSSKAVIMRKEEKAREILDKAWAKTKAGRIHKSHPYWSREDCEALAERRIWIGMSYDMLVYLRGSPNHANPSNYGNGTQWQWCWSDYTPSCFYDRDGDLLIDGYN